MKVNVDTILKNFEGKELKLSPETEELATVKVICTNALLAQYREPLEGKESFMRYELAKKINSGGIVDLKAEEITKIKELLPKLYSPLIVGLVYDILEGEEDASN